MTDTYVHKKLHFLKIQVNNVQKIRLIRGNQHLFLQDPAIGATFFSFDGVSTIGISRPFCNDERGALILSNHSALAFYGTFNLHYTTYSPLSPLGLLDCWTVTPCSRKYVGTKGTGLWDRCTG